MATRVRCEENEGRKQGGKYYAECFVCFGAHDIPVRCHFATQLDVGWKRV